MPTYEIRGVDRETTLDTSLVVNAETRANARMKGELHGIAVTAVVDLTPPVVVDQRSTVTHLIAFGVIAVVVMVAAVIGGTNTKKSAPAPSYPTPTAYTPSPAPVVPVPRGENLAMTMREVELTTWFQKGWAWTRHRVEVEGTARVATHPDFPGFDVECMVAGGFVVHMTIHTKLNEKDGRDGDRFAGTGKVIESVTGWNAMDAEHWVRLHYADAPTISRARASAYRDIDRFHLSVGYGPTSAQSVLVYIDPR